MRGKKAKRLRKQVYGMDFSPRFRKYTKDKNGVVLSDPRRRAYQNAKKISCLRKPASVGK